MSCCSLVGHRDRLSWRGGHRSARFAGAPAIALLAALALLVLAAWSARSPQPPRADGHHLAPSPSLTNPNAPLPNTPGRLTAVASVRARYWKEALEVFEAHPALGAGGGGYETARLRYRTRRSKSATLTATSCRRSPTSGGRARAHARAAGRLDGRRRARHPSVQPALVAARRWRVAAPLQAYTPERIGMLSMLCLVVVFGVHSLVDWTWYVPGDACVALLCAGWLAGRGPLAGRHDRACRPDGAICCRARAQPRCASASQSPWSSRALLAAWSAVAAAALRRSLPAGARAARTDPAAALSGARAGQARPAVGGARCSCSRRSSRPPANRRGPRDAAAGRAPAAVQPATWLDLAEYDLAQRTARSARRAAGGDLPEPESIARSDRDNDTEAIEIENDYARLRAIAAHSRPLRSR